MPARFPRRLARFERVLVLTIAGAAALGNSLALWELHEINERTHILRMSLQSERSARSELAANLQSRLDALVSLAAACAAGSRPSLG